MPNQGNPRSVEVADFRSDTITKPTAEMLRAMGSAEVGDDVLGDDPTVQRLEALAAERFGKEAALFVPSGTMGNQIAIATATRPGEEILVHRQNHCFQYEGGGLARICLVQARLLDGPAGCVPVADFEANLRPDDVHHPRTRLVALEQTHMASGGRVLPLAYIEAVRAFATAQRLWVHIDGARVFNACVAAGVSAARYGALCDSLSFCLSKGLSAPVGSVLVGSRDFVREARRTRKLLGGGMRQAGYLAACGLVALDSMLERLAEDHARAQRLARAFGSLDAGGRPAIDPAAVETNLVILDTPSGAAHRIQGALEERGVRALALGSSRLRFVTHRHIEDRHVERAMEALRAVWST
ncbi:MAG: aminotransferase class I/II-fold pyridoxal phosphate-dependent enzyme [Planctomycetes bacterium]|nr:aminotransferase class I/II-fold pyridoxal phosphate-dependent enzyme [Planctomycetota bacterium]